MAKSYRRKRTSKSLKKGGNCSAATYAQQVYGAGDVQHAQPGGGNLIAMNEVKGGGLNPLSPAIFGGKHRRRTLKNNKKSVKKGRTARRR